MQKIEPITQYVSATKGRLPALTNPGKLHQQAFENSGMAQIIFSGKGTVLLANKAACRLLGCIKKQLIARDRAELVEKLQSWCTTPWK